MVNRSTPSVGQLRAFRAVAEYLHFGHAAAALGLSQSALSAALAGCERAVGGRLVERTTRRVMLTALGEQMLPSAVRVLDAIDQFVTESERARLPFAGTLRLGVIPTIAPYLLPHVITRLRRTHPELSVVIREDRTAKLERDLEAGRCDALLLATPSEGNTELPLYDEDFVLLVPRGHELANAENLPPDVLRDVDVLLLNRGHCLRDQTLDVCRRVGSDPRSTSWAASLATLVQLVAAGLGVTLLPETAVDVELRKGGLAIARFAAPGPGRRVSLVHRTSADHHGEYTALADELRRMLRVKRFPVRLVAPPSIADASDEPKHSPA